MTELIYDSANRLKYNPDLHAKQGTDWLSADEKYLIKNYVTDGVAKTSLALERTMTTIAERVYILRKKGLMPKRPKMLRE